MYMYIIIIMIMIVMIIMQFSTYTLCCIISFQILLMKVYCHEIVSSRKKNHELPSLQWQITLNSYCISAVFKPSRVWLHTQIIWFLSQIFSVALSRFALGFCWLISSPLGTAAVQKGFCVCMFSYEVILLLISFSFCFPCKTWHRFKTSSYR